MSLRNCDLHARRAIPAKSSPRHRLWTAFFLLKLTTFVPLIMLLQPDHIGLAMEALRLGARLSPASRPS